MTVRNVITKCVKLVSIFNRCFREFVVIPNGETHCSKKTKQNKTNVFILFCFNIIEMSYFSTYIIVVFVVKISFILLAISTKIVELGKSHDKELIYKLSFWKERTEFLFKALMSAMLIYIFNPRANNLYLIDGETKLLLYLFGFVLILTANWDTFFKDSVIIKNIQNLIGK